jgi:hypothetical protein
MDALVLITVGALVLAASLRFEGGAGLGMRCGLEMVGVFAVYYITVNMCLMRDVGLFFDHTVAYRTVYTNEGFIQSSFC